MMDLIVDDSTPKFLRVKLVCSECPSWGGIGFPALPTNAVTVNQVLATAVEHLARSHPDLRMPSVPTLTEGEVAGERLPRTDAVGPLS